MKILHLLALSLFMSGWANAQSTTATFTKLDTAGESLPSISHMTEMKMQGNDTLYFVFESEDSHGQRFLRRAVIDSTNTTLTVGPDLGKRDDGYYVSYMPYPSVADNGYIQIINQDDGEIFTVENGTMLASTKQYLMRENIATPLPLSYYVQDIFLTGNNEYIFRGREPNGGRQFAMKADIPDSRIDTLRTLCLNPNLSYWMPNTGEMAYSGSRRRIAFAYRLHPVIELFDMNGEKTNTVTLGEATFDPKTLDEADLEDLNPLHTIDLTATSDYIFALYWGYRFSDSVKASPSIHKLDWDGNIIESYTNIPFPLQKIAAIDNELLIGWSGQQFFLIRQHIH